MSQLARLLLLAVLPCFFWTQAVENRSKVRFSTGALSDVDLTSREALPSPGVTARAGVASPTRAPWINANGWRFARQPVKKYSYSPSAGAAALAAAEAYAYGADAILKIDPADLKRAGD